MYKKLSIAIIATLAASQSFATTSTDPAIAQLQAQLKTVMAQVSTLNKTVEAQSKIIAANKKASENKNTNAMTATTQDIIASHSNDFLVADGYHDAEKFEKQSSSNLPLAFLKEKNIYPQNSVAVGGFVEFEPINTWWGSKIKTTESTPATATAPAHNVYYRNGVGSFVSAVNIDVLGNVGDWGQAFIQTTYSQEDANVSIESGFVTLGNLKKSPFFLNVGQSRVRMGSYTGAPWAATINQGIFRPGHIVNTTVGFSKGNLDANLSYLPGTSTGITDDIASKTEAGFMGSVFYSGDIAKEVSYGVSGGIVSNIAATGNATGSILTDKAIPSSTLDANITLDQFNIATEWSTTLKSDEKTNYDKAGAWYIQGAYTAIILEKDVTFALNYSSAYNTQNIPMGLGGNIKHGPSIYGVQKDIFAYAFSNITNYLGVGLEYAWMQTYTHQSTNEVTLYGALYF